MEVGIGPVCRKLDNAVLARTIPANVARAQAAAARIQDALLPEPCRPTFVQIMTDLLDFSTKDWRTTVKRIEWILSWGMTSGLRKALVEVVNALGYIGLAALLAGEAATGETTVTCESGRIVVRGPRNKAGNYAFKKLAGAKFLLAGNGLKGGWSVPAAHADAVVQIVMTYWPNYSGLDEAIEAAKKAALTAQFVEKDSAVDSKIEKAVPEISISVPVDGWVKVKTPYNVGFIIELKKLPYKVRKWNVVEKVWEVEIAHLADLKALVLKHYKVEPAISAAA